MILAMCIRPMRIPKPGCSHCLPRLPLQPKRHLDKARAIILTDHFRSIADIDGIAERIWTTLSRFVRIVEDTVERPPKTLLDGLLILAVVLSCLAAYLLLR